MKANLLFLHALSPLHAGTGQGVGAIDLPIAREKATGIPIIPGSTLKGVLRANFEGDDATKIGVFGPETDNASAHAGSAQFTDLRLLALPVRSLSGTFAWVTSPLLLRRLQRDCAMADTAFDESIPEVPEESICLIPESGSKLTMTLDGDANQVMMEDLRLSAHLEAAVDTLADRLKVWVYDGDSAWQAYFKKRLCIVHDDVLGFLLDTAMEITPHIRLDDEKKTVARGALWYEETLPVETLLVGLAIVQKVEQSGVGVDKVREAVADVTRTPLQVGGNATVGRGLCRLRFVQ